jgi:CRISPR-associated protein Csm3
MSAPTMDFSKIESQTTFTITLKLVTPLHIGGNFDDDIKSDLPIIKTADDTPFIPGSSIKGVLRSASERLSHIFGLNVCYLENGGCGQNHKDDIKTAIETLSDSQAYADIYGRVCPSCQTYGIGSISSKVKVNHVYLKNYKTMIRDGIMIDRETGTVKPTAKFDYEYIEADQTFTIEIEGNNLTDENKEVLALAFAQLKNGSLRFGGLQARGLGQVEYVEGSVREMSFSETNREDAINFLLGESDTSKVITLESFLEKALKRGRD